MILGIYGSGGAGKGAKEIADLQGKWSEIVFIDDTVEPDTFKNCKRMPFEQFCEKYSPSDAEVVIAQGEPEFKKLLFKKAKDQGYKLANVIHPSVYVSPDAQLGEGIIAQMGCMIAVDTKIGDNVTLEQYAVVAHDSVIEEHAQISAFVMIAGNCVIGSGTYIGIGVPVRDSITIGKDSIISMGSVVQRNIPDAVIAMGNPARVMKNRDGERVFK
jgi:sugar O-acyltransferase (sialic acid O-acetyltransferase NeuD family)